MTNYKKKFVQGSFITSFFFGLAGLVTYVNKIILARALDPYIYGLVFSVLAVISILGMLKNMGLQSSLVKYVPEFVIKKKYGEIKGSILFVFCLQLAASVIFAAIVFLVSDYLAAHFFHDTRTVFIIKVLALYVVLLPVSHIMQTVFKSFHNFGWSSSIEFTRMFLTFICTFFFLVRGFDYFSPAYGYLAAVVILPLVYLPFFLKKYSHVFHVKVLLTRNITRKIVVFGTYTFLTSVGFFLMGYIDTIMITWLLSLEAAGIYNVAQSTSRVTFIIFSSMMGILMTMVAEMIAKKHFKELAKGIFLILKYAFIVITPTVVVFLVFPDLILYLLFGGEYAVGNNILRILSLGVTVAIITNIIVDVTH